RGAPGEAQALGQPPRERRVGADELDDLAASRPAPEELGLHGAHAAADVEHARALDDAGRQGGERLGLDVVQPVPEVGVHVAPGVVGAEHLLAGARAAAVAAHATTLVRARV